MAGKNVEIIAFTTKGEPKGQFDSIKKAVEKLDIDQAAISRVLSGKSNHAKGIVFLKVEDMRSRMQTVQKIVRFFQIQEMNFNEFLKYDL